MDRADSLFVKRERGYNATNVEHRNVFDAITYDRKPMPGQVNRWLYAWTAAVKTDTTITGQWIPVPGGKSSRLNVNNEPDHFALAAQNDWETHNDGVGEEGFGVIVDDPTATYLIEMLPIPNFIHVTMVARRALDGKVFYSFAAPNAYKIICGAQAQ